METEVLSRLEKGFQDQASSLQHTRDDVSQLKVGYGVIQRDMISLTAGIEKLVSRFEDSRKTNWPLLALLAGLLPIIIGGIGFFITSYTANAISPVHAELLQVESNMKAMSDQQKDIGNVQIGRGKDVSLLAQTTTANSEILNRVADRLRIDEEAIARSSGADISSQADRQQINHRIQKLEETLATEITDRRSQSAEVRVQIAEIEQQFHSVSNLENIRAAQQERLNSMLWEKSHPGERYPNGTFFPTSIFQGMGGSAPMMNNNAGNP